MRDSGAQAIDRDGRSALASGDRAAFFAKSQNRKNRKGAIPGEAKYLQDAEGVYPWGYPFQHVRNWEKAEKAFYRRLNGRTELEDALRETQEEGDFYYHGKED